MNRAPIWDFINQVLLERQKPTPRPVPANMHHAKEKAMQTNQTESLKWMACKWTVHEDDDRVTLQIELGNGHALTLTAYKDGRPNSVAKWYGSGEHPFVDHDGRGDESAERFKEELQEAAEGVAPVERPPAPDHQQRRSFFLANSAPIANRLV